MRKTRRYRRAISNFVTIELRISTASNQDGFISPKKSAVSLCSQVHTACFFETIIHTDGSWFSKWLWPLWKPAWVLTYRILCDLRLISFQQRFISPVWFGPPPLSLLHSVPSSCPSPSTVDWHGTQWHPGHEGRPAAKNTHTAGHTQVSITVWTNLNWSLIDDVLLLHLKPLRWKTQNPQLLLWHNISWKRNKR